MTASADLLVPYGHGSDGKLRPYLWRELTGPRDDTEITVSGLVDTGADRSVFPIEYAQTLGYRIDDLAPVELGQVEGSLSAWEGSKPCSATVRGLPNTRFQIKPLFAANLDALWGRADLMTAFDLTLSERDKRFALHVP